jgi:DnaK suppressor protein
MTVEAEEAKALLGAERARVEGLLEDATRSGQDDRSAASEPGNRSDSAEPLTSELTNDAVAAELRLRLEAIGRAERRIEEGTYGRSVRSGEPIADERLRADPTAELTVEEANQGV